jgi:hypothetical protein
MEAAPFEQQPARGNSMQAIMDIDPPAAQVAQAVIVSEDWAAPGARPAPPKPPRAVAPVATESGIAQAAATAPVELTDPRIKRAVAATVAETPDRSTLAANQQDGLRPPVFGADTPDQYKRFAEGFAYAKVPYCLGDNGLKFQPAKIGFIGFSGLLALPFVVVAKMRGKCK